MPFGHVHPAGLYVSVAGPRPLLAGQNDEFH